MEKLRLIATTIIILCAGVAFGSPVKQTGHWKTYKLDNGAKVTASVSFDNGYSAYFGDSSGNIYSINKYKKTLVCKSPAGGAIDSIVATDREFGLGDFTFTSGGEVYTYYKGSETVKDLQLPYSSSFLAFRDGRGLFCAAATNGGTDSSSIFYYYPGGNNNWLNFSSPDFKSHNITALSYTSSGVFTAVNSGDGTNKIYRYHNGEWNFRKELDANVVKITSNQFDSKKIDLSVSNGNTLLMDSDNAKVVSTSDSSIGNVYSIETLNSTFLVSSNGETVKVSKDVIPQELAIKNISYVCQAPGVSNDVIYRVTIIGGSLTQSQLFQEGMNGFKYKLTLTDSAGDDLNSYSKTEYPLTGVKYTTGDYGKTAVLTPGTISFLWKGPSLDSKPDATLSVTEYCYDFSKKSEEPVGNPCIKELPADQHWQSMQVDPDTQNYYGYSINNISFQTLNSGRIYGNGTCALPFSIIIDGSCKEKDGSQHKIVPADDIYDHLIFLNTDSVTGNTTNLAGNANPYPETYQGENCESICVLPASVFSGNIKYGLTGSGLSTSGRIYYAFTGTNNLDDSIPSITKSLQVEYIDYIASATGGVPLGQVGNSTTSLSLTELNSSPHVFVNSTGPNFQLPTTSNCEIVISMAGGIKCSNWTGDSAGNNAGYIDYYLPNNDECPDADISNAGVYAVFPEGLNDLSLAERMDPHNMEVGFYIAPDRNATPSGLRTDSYTIYPKAGLCYATRDIAASGSTLRLFVYLFDEDGVINQAGPGTGAIDPGDPNKTTWDNDNPKVDQSGNIAVRIHNEMNVPVVATATADSQDLGGIPDLDGVFIPPVSAEASLHKTELSRGMKEYDDFITTVSWVSNNSKKWEKLELNIGGILSGKVIENYFNSNISYMNTTQKCFTKNISSLEFKSSENVDFTLPAADQASYFLPIEQEYFFKKSGGARAFAGWEVALMPWNYAAGFTKNGWCYNEPKGQGRWFWTFSTNTTSDGKMGNNYAIKLARKYYGVKGRVLPVSSPPSWIVDGDYKTSDQYNALSLCPGKYSSNNWSD